MLEGGLLMVHVVIYLVMVFKFNAFYVGFKVVLGVVQETGMLEVLRYFCNVFTGFMVELGYGQGYCYFYNYGGYVFGELHFLEKFVGVRFYELIRNGYEVRIDDWLKVVRAETLEIGDSS